MAYKYADSFTLPGQYDYDPDMMLAGDSPREQIDKLKAMTLEPSDVVVCSYPKTGTTLLQEIVWLLRFHADEEKALVPNYLRVPLVEKVNLDTLSLFYGLEHPRHLKTHLPFHHLPQQVAEKNVKVCYVYRNPRDTLVSYYHFHQMLAILGPFEGSFDDFFDYFYRVRNGNILCGSIMKHVKSFWQHRHDSNIFITTYEQLIKDPNGEIRKIADFLQIDYSSELIEKVCAMTTFSSMKANPATNFEVLKGLGGLEDAPPFMRKGKVGDWVNYFSEDQVAKLDGMIQRELGDTDIVFTYE